MILCGIYNSIVEKVNNYLYPKENEENTQENTEKEIEQPKEENKENPEQAQEKEPENDESLTQSEISQTEVSETDRIKNTYAFILPVTRNSIIRIWYKGGNRKCYNCIP